MGERLLGFPTQGELEMTKRQKFAGFSPRGELGTMV